MQKNIEAIILAVMYLSCLYLWTLPIQQNPMPYGEVDAVSHFTIADYTSDSDKPITSLPYYIDRRYGMDNSFKPHTLWYPPPFHMDLAIAQIMGGERILPIFLLNAVFSTSILIVLYFVVRKMYGFWPALLSSLLIMFSMRDINIYLWGQWPERLSYYITPLVIYCFYRYYLSFRAAAEKGAAAQKQKPIYLYIMAILLAINLYIHPVGLFHSAAALGVISTLLFIRDRKIPFDIKTIGISVALFLLLASIFPFQTGNMLAKSQAGSGSQETGFDMSRLFSWYQPPDGVDLGLPPSHFSYNDSHGAWTFPFLLAGLVFLLIRRKPKDLFMLGWLISLYIMLHLDIIGTGRSFRSLSATAHIFYPIMAIGAVYFVSMITNILNIWDGIRQLLKYGAIILFIIFALFVNGKAAYSQLDGAYSGISRITPAQYEAAEWIKHNIHDNSAELYQEGAISQAKSRWEWMLSNRVISFKQRKNATHAIIDYSDAAALGDQRMIIAVQQAENAAENSTNAVKLYDKDNIKVYDLGRAE